VCGLPRGEHVRELFDKQGTPTNLGKTVVRVCEAWGVELLPSHDVHETCACLFVSLEKHTLATTMDIRTLVHNRADAAAQLPTTGRATTPSSFKRLFQDSPTKAKYPEKLAKKKQKNPLQPHPPGKGLLSWTVCLTFAL
jgi:hypothetical protein